MNFRVLVGEKYLLCGIERVLGVVGKKFWKIFEYSPETKIGLRYVDAESSKTPNYSLPQKKKKKNSLTPETMQKRSIATLCLIKTDSYLAPYVSTL